VYQTTHQPAQPFKVGQSGLVARPKETTPLRFGDIQSAKVPEPTQLRAQSAPSHKPVEIVRAYQKFPEQVHQPEMVNPGLITI
jgi:hypothetical protein